MKGQILLFPMVAIAVCIAAAMMGLAWYWFAFGVLVVSPLISVTFIAIVSSANSVSATAQAGAKGLTQER